jgi:hypothetical protein
VAPVVLVERVVESMVAKMTGGRRPRRAGAWSDRGLVLLVNAMLVGVGGVFVATGSVLVTGIAAAAAAGLAVVIVLAGR